VKKTKKRERVDKNLLAYCGLYCGDCPGYQGNIADLARDLRKVLRESRFDVFAREIPVKEFKNYPQCYECLGAMVKTRCRRTCRGRGGPTHCKIRNCCLKRGYEGCWECAEFEDCSKLAWLTKVHKDAHIKNMRILAKKGIGALVASQRSW
jgi:hypothetical protein